jgi:hypothetical protein
VIGAHLDSVSRGPGINNNGSGSATILEVAEVFASQMRDTRNKLRLIWFAAEELNLLGSQYYIDHLSPAERDAIELNLNFDMIGSPNVVRFVYDGNNSASAPPNAQPGPTGSGAMASSAVRRVTAASARTAGFLVTAMRAVAGVPPSSPYARPRRSGLIRHTLGHCGGGCWQQPGARIAKRLPPPIQPRDGPDPSGHSGDGVTTVAGPAAGPGNRASDSEQPVTSVGTYIRGPRWPSGACCRTTTAQARQAWETSA